MPKKNKTPPLLKGFTTSGAGKGKVLSNPTTSLWLAIIFIAIFAGLMSIQRNINNANDSLLKNQKGIKHSGYIVDAPEKRAELVPPPDPELFRASEDEPPVFVEDTIELKNESGKIKLKPIDVEMAAKLPEDFLKPDQNYQ